MTCFNFCDTSLSLISPSWSKMSCCSFHSLLFLLHLLSVGNPKYFCSYIIHISIILKYTLFQFSFLSSRLRTSRFLLNVSCYVECPKTLKFSVPSHSSLLLLLSDSPHFFCKWHHDILRQSSQKTWYFLC